MEYEAQIAPGEGEHVSQDTVSFSSKISIQTCILRNPSSFLQDWIFDCLITFLKSPRWKTPVVSYIEEYCIIFDNEEENKLEYTTIHMVSVVQINLDVLEPLLKRSSNTLCGRILSTDCQQLRRWQLKNRI